MKPPHPRPAIVLRRTAAGAVAVAAALTVAPTVLAGGPVVQPSQVAGIVAAYSAANNRANALLNLVAQNRDEQGSAAVIDDADFAAARLERKRTSEGAHYYRFSFTLAAASVPHQATYPARVVTIDRQAVTPSAPRADRPSPGCRSLLLFQRNALRAPWRVSLEPSIAVSAHLTFQHTAQGYGLAVPSSRGLATPIGRIPSMLAASLMAAVPAGIPSPLPPSVFSAPANGGCWALPDPHQWTAAAVFGASAALFRTAPTVAPNRPSDVVAVRLRGGAALVCFTLRATLTETALAPSQHTIVFFSGTRESNAGAFMLAKGARWRRVTLTALAEVAVVDPPKAGGGPPLRVVGGYWNWTAATGIPA